MTMSRIALASLGLCAALHMAAPASAQVFYEAPRLTPRPITTLDPAFDPDLPGASPAEKQAVLVWSLRQALLLGALQCHTQYPTLLATSNYNALLTNHQGELASAFKAITDYFKRTQKDAKAAQIALDRFATRTTTVYSTVRGQQAFCNTAGWVGRRAVFSPRGSLSALASAHLGELRQSLTAPGEQKFRFTPIHGLLSLPALPSMNPRCWDKKNRFNAKKCR
ncbi:MAG: hypothetical protein RL425_1616 [Pseudomonadota bacterium]